MAPVTTDESNGLLHRVGGVRGAAFYAAVLAAIALPVALLQIFLAFPIIALVDPSMASNPHLIHDVAFMGLIWVTLVGMLTQLYRPTRRVAGMLQALVVLAAFAVGLAVVGFTIDPTVFDEATFIAMIFGLPAVAALLHPAGRELLRTRTAGRFSPLLAGLAVVAAVPLVPYAIEQFTLQGTGDMHAMIHHYAGMLIFSGVLVALGLLASLKPTGWRVPLFSAAGMALGLGVFSVLYPGAASSAGTMWGGAAIAWGLVFAVAGEVSARRTPPIADEPDEPKARAA